MRFKKRKKIKKIYLLPNLLTTGNFFCGIYSIALSMNGSIEKAAWILFVAMLFDFLDGQAARMNKASSRFGMEYDSLSDVVSFGIAPGVLIYSACFNQTGKVGGKIGLAVMFIYSASCALRLARYNTQAASISHEENNKPMTFFSGLPSPAAAGLIAAFLVMAKKYELLYLEKFLPVVAICAAYLMISSVKYPKFSNLRILKEHHFWALVMLVSAIGTMIFFPAVFLFGWACCYTLYGLMKEFRKKEFNPQKAGIKSPLPDKNINRVKQRGN